MQETQLQLDERFLKTHTYMEQIQTRMDKEKKISNSRYENIMGLLTKLTAQSDKPNANTNTSVASSSSGIT